MSLTIELTPELEREVAKCAQQSGQNVSEFVAVTLREKVAAPRELPDLDELIEETGQAARRAGIHTLTDVTRLVDDVRRELGTHHARAALRELGRIERDEMLEFLDSVPDAPPVAGDELP